jgi:hypothetical protein
MSHAQHDDGGYDPMAARRSRRRRKAAVGAAGLAALLGGGAYLVTDLITDKPETIASESGVVAPLARPSMSPSPSVSRSRPGSTRAGAGASSKTASPSTSAGSKSAVQAAKDARTYGNKHRVPQTRPLPLPSKTVAPSGVTVTNSGAPGARTTLRVISARGDLTGQRELAWVADEGTAVGNARCTQTFRFSDNGAPSRKPTMLICWRTSAARSVITLMVNLDGHPSKAASSAALNKRWAELA